MIGSKHVFVIGAALALAVGACKKDEAERTPAPTKSDPARGTRTPDSPEAPPPGNRSAEPMLAAYERARAALAADETKGLPEIAAELERTAMEAAATGPAGTTDHFRAVASAAKSLGTAADVDGARLAFGEISRHVIALLAADKALAEGKHVFECPMTAGYRKWVQPSEKLENPYMGTKMLSCGGESTWQ
jgi:Cu(I)/Ag(I) efflux system membrane fusion protein